MGRIIMKHWVILLEEINRIHVLTAVVWFLIEQLLFVLEKNDKNRMIKKIEDK